MPYVKPKFNLLGLKLLSHTTSLIQSTVNPIFIEFDQQNDNIDTKMICSIDDNAQSIVVKDNKSSKYGITCFLPNSQVVHTLEVYADEDKKIENQTFPNIATFKVTKLMNRVNMNIPNYEINFNGRLTLLSHSSGFISFNRNPLTLQFSSSIEGYRLSAKLNHRDEKGIENTTLCQRHSSNKIDLNVILPLQHQVYELILFDDLHQTGRLLLYRDHGDFFDSSRFFKVFTAYEDYNVFTVSPLDNDLKVEVEYVFEYHMHGVLQAIIHEDVGEPINLSSATHLENLSGNVWRATKLFKNKGKIGVYVKGSDGPTWNGLCHYNVD